MKVFYRLGWVWRKSLRFSLVSASSLLAGAWGCSGRAVCWTVGIWVRAGLCRGLEHALRSFARKSWVIDFYIICDWRWTKGRWRQRCTHLDAHFGQSWIAAISNDLGLGLWIRKFDLGLNWLIVFTGILFLIFWPALERLAFSLVCSPGWIWSRGGVEDTCCLFSHFSESLEVWLRFVLLLFGEDQVA